MGRLNKMRRPILRKISGPSCICWPLLAVIYCQLEKWSCMKRSVISKMLCQILIFMVIGLAIIGCNTSEVIENETPDSIAESPVSQSIKVSSPIPTPTTTPRPGVSQPFSLDKPIKIGATSVSGTGPAGVPILIYEVANTADLLGHLTIPEDGKFLIEFERPLQPSERVGVVLDLENLAKTDYEYEDFRQVAEVEVPVYGLVLADVEVEP